MDENSSLEKSSPKSVGNVETFPCTHEGCNRTFYKKAHLERHQKLHSGERPFNCSNCGKCFGRKDHLQRHLKSHGIGIISLFECSEPNCDKRFLTNQHLKRHLKTHIAPFRCDVCNATFKKDSLLNAHRAICPTMQEDIPMPECLDSCKDLGEISSPQDSKENYCGSFRCPFSPCDSQYLSLSGLRKHLRLHNGLGKYSCTDCPETFVRYMDLVAHKKSNHVKKYNCNVCEKSFTRSRQLNEHIRMKHLLLPAGIDPPTFVCTEYACGLAFSTKSNLKAHIRVKHMTQCFSCDICGASFSWRITLSKHMLKFHKQDSLVDDESKIKETCDEISMIMQNDPSFEQDLNDGTKENTSYDTNRESNDNLRFSNRNCEDKSIMYHPSLAPTCLDNEQLTKYSSYNKLFVDSLSINMLKD